MNPLRDAANRPQEEERAMFLSREEVRAVDRRAIDEFGMPGVVLMENAGRGAAAALMGLGVRGTVLICCGKGNNGGDGFVIARHLDNHRIPVRVLLFSRPEELAGDAALNYQILARSGVPLAVRAEPAPDLAVLRRELNAAEWVVDALFGTGLSGPVKPPFDQIIATINDCRARVLAVDLPSGLDCDTGQPLGPTVKAEHTVTFVAPKKGFAQPTASAWVGRVHVVDIGVPRRLLDRSATPST
jgi:NAD(P)H-hydrate epimerase